MYREALRLTIRLRNCIALAVLCNLLISIMMEINLIGFPGFLLTFVIWSTFSYFSYLEILFPDQKALRTDLEKMMYFNIRHAGLWVFALLPVVALYSGVTGNMTTTETGPQTFSVGFPEVIGVISLGILGIIILGMIGTVLPAFVIDGARGLGKAYARGTALFSITMGQLIFGPGLVFSASSIFYFSFIMLVESGNLSVLISGPLYILSTFLYSVFQACSLIMISWILSKEFLAYENKDIDILSSEISVQKSL